VNVLLVQQLAWGIRIGGEIARVLTERGHRVSALVHGREMMDEIHRQRAVAYGSVHFADPLYDAGGDTVSPEQVTEIETRYGLDSLWRVLYCERWLVFTFLDSRRFVPRKPVSNDYILSVAWNTYRFVRDVVDVVRPAYVLAPAVGSLANYFLYLECRRAGIPFYTISFTRFGKSFYVADDLYLCSTRVSRRFKELVDAPERSAAYGEARRLYGALRRNDPGARPSYLDRARRPAVGTHLLRAGRDVGVFPLRVARAVLRPRRVMAIRNIWMPANSRWNGARTVWIDLRERFRRTDRQGECLRDLGRLTFDYVHFPLHVEPELSLLVFAPDYANQIELCRRIALGLPRGVRLLVKEQPLMVPARPRRFYDDLRGLPNVEVLHSSVPSHAVLTHPRCRAALVVSSSVGFEAAVNGCPVVLLAPVQYAELPGVTLAASIEHAVDRLRALCTRRPPETEGDERARLAYLCALLENSVSFDYVERWSAGQGQLDVAALVDAVEARLREADTPETEAAPLQRVGNPA
jgi:hypothetical protein